MYEECPVYEPAWSVIQARKCHRPGKITRRTGDAIGVFLVLLPSGPVFGADHEGELAWARGEVPALEGTVSINCAAQSTDGGTDTNAEASISDRLQQINSLLADGLISEDEAADRRKVLLDQL